MTEQAAAAAAHLLTEQVGGVTTITLNRPEVRNTLTTAMLNDLTELFEQFNADDSVQCIVLTGSGRAFCAGLDLKSLAAGGIALGASDSSDMPLMRAMANCSKPIIGAINGFAVTGGFELALACDFLYAAQSAKFADTHARVGLLPEWGLSQKLARIVGINRAREISFSGNYFGAEQAEAWGLVNRVVEDDQLAPVVQALAQQITECVPSALQQIKRVMNEGWEGSLAEGLRMETDRAFGYNSKVDMTQMTARLAELKARSKRN
jgi:enoyl-CoA hydratase/carnithine racemase